MAVDTHNGGVEAQINGAIGAGSEDQWSQIGIHLMRTRIRIHQSEKSEPHPHQSENRLSNRIRDHVKKMQIRTQKILLSSQKIYIWCGDPGFEKTYPGSGGSKKHGIPDPDPQHHRLNMEVDLQSLFGLHVT
jgi:hypothetical protein